VGYKLRLAYKDVVRRRRSAGHAGVAWRSAPPAGLRRTDVPAESAAPSRSQAGDRPLVSIVLPTFNRLHYLRVTVDSILAQSLRDWELLIADDGSAAETRAYLRSLEDAPRIRVIWLPHTGNPAAARNAALHEARGEFIAFIDSDDVWLPEKLAAQVGALQSRTGCGWCYTGFTMVDGAGRPLTGGRALRCRPIEGWILEPLLNGHATIVTSSVLARRALLEAEGGCDEAFRVCEDLELLLRLAQRSEIAFVDAPLVHLRRHREHYADDVTACEYLERVFDKLHDGGVAACSRPAVQKGRALASAVLARSYAANGRRGRALGKLIASLHYGWPHAEWWRRGLATAATALAPTAVKRLRRRLRPAPVASVGPVDL
jgi:glycosyltransferase involved in cell wall biosynthesis